MPRSETMSEYAEQVNECSPVGALTSCMFPIIMGYGILSTKASCPTAHLCPYSMPLLCVVLISPQFGRLVLDWFGSSNIHYHYRAASFPPPRKLNR